MDDDRTVISLALNRRLLDRVDDMTEFYGQPRSSLIRETLRAAFESCRSADPDFSAWLVEDDETDAEGDVDAPGDDVDADDDDRDEADPNEGAAEEGL